MVLPHFNILHNSVEQTTCCIYMVRHNSTITSSLIFTIFLVSRHLDIFESQSSSHTIPNRLASEKNHNF